MALACRTLALGSVLVWNLGGPVMGADPPAAADKLPPGAVLEFGRPRFQRPTFGGHAAFSPDGKLLATWAQNTGGIVVWDVAAGQIVRTHKASTCTTSRG